MSFSLCGMSRLVARCNVLHRATSSFSSVSWSSCWPTHSPSPSASSFSSLSLCSHTSSSLARPFSSYPSRSNMRAVPVAEYPPSEGGVQQVQVDHAVAPEFVEPVSAEDVEGNVFQPSVFAVADINGQQTKVHAGCLVMTDNLKLAPRAAYKREMFALNGVGSPDYAGPQGDALQEELNYWWEQLSVEEKQPYYEQQIQVGDRLVFDRVLLLGAMDWTVIGRPLVEGARVHATVKEHSETEKLIVYKKKRRKGYAKQKHHQSQVTVLHIDEVVHANGVDSCLDHYAAQEAAQQQQSAAEDSDVDSDSESQTTTTSQ